MLRSVVEGLAFMPPSPTYGESSPGLTWLDADGVRVPARFVPAEAPSKRYKDRSGDRRVGIRYTLNVEIAEIALGIHASALMPTRAHAHTHPAQVARGRARAGRVHARLQPRQRRGPRHGAGVPGRRRRDVQRTRNAAGAWGGAWDGAGAGRGRGWGRARWGWDESRRVPGPSCSTTFTPHHAHCADRVAADTCRSMRSGTTTPGMARSSHAADRRRSQRSAARTPHSPPSSRGWSAKCRSRAPSLSCTWHPTDRVRPLTYTRTHTHPTLGDQVRAQPRERPDRPPRLAEAAW